MSTTHLKKGDPLPPLAKDTLRIYSMKYCPFAQRARMVLAHKQIPHENVNVNLSEKPDWFFERNPLGMVPILEKNDQVLYESGICSEYLDEAFPQKPLFPSDPYGKAYIKVLMEHYGKIVPKFYSIRKVTGDELTAVLTEMQTAFQRFEKELGDKKYFGGDGPNMLDFHMWPWFERIPDMEKILPKNKLPKLNKWTASMWETDAVKATDVGMKPHQFFINSYTKGLKIEYDAVISP